MRYNKFLPISISVLPMLCCFVAWAQSASLESNREFGVVTESSNESFPDYSQPTTRYVTSGQNLRSTRKFGLEEQMNRESLGILAR
jgi:hypothetical protein